MRNKKRPAYFFYFFAFGILLCMMISTILLTNVPKPMSLPLKEFSSSDYFQNNFENNIVKQQFLKIDNNSTKLNEFKTKPNNEDSEFTRSIRSIIHNSYLSYVSKCSSSDYLRPISEVCLNSSGLSITTVESLETLYFTDLFDDFKKSSNFVLNEFSCSASKFQNFHEMGTKILGGLIGIYGLTKNYKFIEKAVECADLMKSAFKSSVPHPIIDGINHRAKKYSFIDGNFLSESSGFIFEFSVLSQITGDSTYQAYVQNYLNCILSIIKSTKTLPTTFSVDKCQQSSEKSSVFQGEKMKNKHNELNEYTISFIANVIRLHLYSPSNTTSEIIDFVYELISKFNQKFHVFHSSFCQLDYLMKEIPKLNSSQFYHDLKQICNSISQSYDFPVLKSDASHLSNIKVKNDGFYFDFVPLINSNVYEKNSAQLKYLNRLNFTKCKKAQCALISQNPIVHDDLMPTELLSKWLKFLYLTNSSVFDFSKKNWIINEAGHLILSDVI